MSRCNSQLPSHQLKKKNVKKRSCQVLSHQKTTQYLSWYTVYYNVLYYIYIYLSWQYEVLRSWFSGFYGYVDLRKTSTCELWSIIKFDPIWGMSLSCSWYSYYRIHQCCMIQRQWKSLSPPSQTSKQAKPPMTNVMTNTRRRHVAGTGARRHGYCGMAKSNCSIKTNSTKIPRKMHPIHPHSSKFHQISPSFHHHPLVFWCLPGHGRALWDRRAAAGAVAAAVGLAAGHGAQGAAEGLRGFAAWRPGAARIWGIWSQNRNPKLGCSCWNLCYPIVETLPIKLSLSEDSAATLNFDLKRLGVGSFYKGSRIKVFKL